MQLLFDENRQDEVFAALGACIQVTEDRTASPLYSEFINTKIKNACKLRAFLPSILLFVNRVNGY